MAAMSGIDGVREQVPLAERTWFKVGGAAQFFAEPTSVDELQAVVKRCRDEGLHVRLLGGGSNVLVRDEGVSGMVISLVESGASRTSQPPANASRSAAARCWPMRSP